METLSAPTKITTVAINEITTEMQDAFAEIGRRLIFTGTQKFPLSKRNAKAISQQIQDEFIEGFDRNYFRMCAPLHNLIIDFGKQIHKEDPKETVPTLHPEFSIKFSDKNNKDDPKAYIRNILAYLWIQGHQDDTWDNLMYKARGYTPKLAFASEELTIISEMNCLGYNIYLGSLCKNVLNIPTYFGIAPDHPFTFVVIGEHTYIIDGQSSSRGIQRAKGKILECDGYTIYYPRNKKEHRATQMVFVHDFDNAVLYEILENLEALKQAAQGNVGVLLPTYRDNVLSVVEEHREFLIKGAWKEMQRIIFPEIYNSFIQHAQRWHTEVSRVRKVRQRGHIRHETLQAWKKILSKAAIAAGWSELKHKELADTIAKCRKENKIGIIKYLFEGASEIKGAPSNITAYYRVIFEETEKLPSEMRQIIQNDLRNSYFDKKKRR